MKRRTLIASLAICSTVQAAPNSQQAIPVRHAWRNPAVEVEEIHISSDTVNHLEPWDPRPVAKFLESLRPLGHHQLAGMPPRYIFEAKSDAEIPAPGRVVLATIGKANAAGLKYDACLQIAGAKPFALRTSGVDGEQATALRIGADGRCELGDTTYSAAEIERSSRSHEAQLADRSLEILLPQDAPESATVWHFLAALLPECNKTDEWGTPRRLYSLWLLPLPATPGSNRASGKR